MARGRPQGLGAGVGYFESLDEALEIGPEVIFLSSPAVHHVEGIRKCLEAGAHVFCEKPLSATTEGLGALLELAETNRRVLFVGYNLRFHACIAEMKRAVEAGEIGKPLTLFAEVGQYLPSWRPHKDYQDSVSAQKQLGGGALLELSHEIDLAVLFGGREVSGVAGRFGKESDLDLDVEDYANLRIEFGGGLSAMLHLDFMQNPGGRWCRVIGTRGTLEWGGRVEPAGVEHTDYATGDQFVKKFPAAAERNHSYLAQMKAFAGQIDAGVWVSQATRDAALVVEIVDRVKQMDKT